MDITVLYSDVFTQCQMLSSYEGREAVSPSGESDYLKVHLTDQDKPLIKSYTNQAVDEIRKNLGRLIENTSLIYTTSASQTAGATTGTTTASREELGSTPALGIKLSIGTLDSKRVSTGTLSTMIPEALSAWIMMQWCSNHLPTRQEFYQALFVEMVDGVKRMVFRKRSPELEV